MRNYSLYLVTLFVCLTSITSAKSIQANFQYFTFQNSDGQNYIETYFTFLSTSIQYQKVDDQFYKGTIKVDLSFESADSTTLITDSYIFNTPLITDTLEATYFVDKQVFALNNGNYKLKIQLKDSNSEPLKTSTSIAMDISNKVLCFSDIVLLSSFEPTVKPNILSKSGYDLLPLQNKGAYFIDDSETKLEFYVEWYNADLDTYTQSQYLLNYFIENEQTNIPITDFNVIKKHEGRSAFIGGFDISSLASGNYNFVFCLLNKEGRGLVQKKVFFQRKNSSTILKPDDYLSLNFKGSFVDEYNDPKHLAEDISSLFPVATQSERSYAKNQLNKFDLNEMKRFFYGFWFNRKPLAPEEEWQKYYKAVKQVNEAYSTISVKGFATDRGYYFLKYGAPDYIENSIYDNLSLPYQIWHYYKLNKQTNKIFIFAETALGTNEYQLIHSTAQGELYNENWKDIVYRTRHNFSDDKQYDGLNPEENIDPTGNKTTD